MDRREYDWLLSDEAFPELEVLWLDAADISDETLRMGMGRLWNLKRLELLNCEYVSGAAVKRFVHLRDKNFTVFIDACPFNQAGRYKVTVKNCECRESI